MQIQGQIKVIQENVSILNREGKAVGNRIADSLEEREHHTCISKVGWRADLECGRSCLFHKPDGTLTASRKQISYYN